jgi:hypothetical protein
VKKNDFTGSPIVHRFAHYLYQGISLDGIEKKFAMPPRVQHGGEAGYKGVFSEIKSSNQKRSGSFILPPGCVLFFGYRKASIILIYQ